MQHQNSPVSYFFFYTYADSCSLSNIFADKTELSLASANASGMTLRCHRVEYHVNSRRLSRFGRPDIRPWPASLGLSSKDWALLRRSDNRHRCTSRTRSCQQGLSRIELSKSTPVHCSSRCYSMLPLSCYGCCPTSPPPHIVAITTQPRGI